MSAMTDFGKKGIRVPLNSSLHVLSDWRENVIPKRALPVRRIVKALAH